jgi:hypothetical protein
MIFISFQCENDQIFFVYSPTIRCPTCHSEQKGPVNLHHDDFRKKWNGKNFHRDTTEKVLAEINLPARVLR